MEVTAEQIVNLKEQLKEKERLLKRYEDEMKIEEQFGVNKEQKLEESGGGTEEEKQE